MFLCNGELKRLFITLFYVLKTVYLRGTRRIQGHLILFKSVLNFSLCNGAKSTYTNIQSSVRD